jgi:hypothetical protein
MSIVTAEDRLFREGEAAAVLRFSLGGSLDLPVLKLALSLTLRRENIIGQ